MRRPRELSVVIPAAGSGRRMRSYGPKPLLDLSGHSLLHHQVAVIRSAFPRAEIVVVVGFEAERVLRALPPGVKAVENENYAATNVLRSIGMGLRVAAHANVLLLYGDVACNRATIEAVVAGGSGVAVDTQGRVAPEGVGVTVVRGGVTRFDYGLPAKWAHIAHLAGRDLDLFRRVAWDPANRVRLGFEGLNEVLERGGRLRAVEPPGMKVVQLDGSRDIERARRLYDAGPSRDIM